MYSLTYKSFYFSLFKCILLLALSSCATPKTKHEKPQALVLRYPPPLIAIDAGHGGKDRGTSSLDQKYHEKHLSLSLALMLKQTLEEKGYRTLMTRKQDSYLSLKRRVKISADASCLISLHFNSAKNTNAQGIEIFYCKNRKQDNKRSLILAENILANTCAATHAQSRGVKTANFYVIKESQIPAILFEGGFLTNQYELSKVKNPLYLRQMALGIARGIDQFYNKNKAS